MTTPDSSGTADATISRLAQALGGGTDVTPWNARQQLEAIGPPAVPALVDALQDDDSDTRWEAAKALITIADPRSATPLIVALDDDNGSVRWLAAEGLSRIGTPALSPLLHALIEHSGSAWLREGAHHVIKANMTDDLAPVLRPVLTALAHPDPEIAVMPAASRALATIESLPPPVPTGAATEFRATRLPTMTPSHGTWRNLRF